VRQYLLSAAAVLAACSASPPGNVDSGFLVVPDGAAEEISDARPPGPDARMAECPDGLPDSFDSSGNVINKNTTPLDPPYDHYNVFADLDGNERWFFAMNLWVDRGIFDGGVVPGKYDIAGEDTDNQYCSLCIDLFARYDLDEPGSLHMVPQKGTLVITSVSGGEVSGRLEDVLLGAIEIVYDEEGESCDDIEDPVCVNSICLNEHCGRQVGLVGCSTSITRMDF
jgi:hypothetical protein